MYGKNIEIEQINIRFQDYHHFLDFIIREYDNYTAIFAVVPESWKQLVLEEGFLVGTIHRPKLIRNQGKKKRVFRISFGEKEDVLSKTYGTKGYHRRRKNKRR
jgi:hypothetical protein